MNGYHAPIQYKHSGRSRRHYNRYGRKKLRINLTVLFVVLFIIGCFVGAVVLGNYLKDKVGGAGAGDDTFFDTNDKADTGPHPSVSDAAQSHASHRSGCFFPYASEDIYALAGRIFDSGYDSVTIPLKDSSGTLLYYSSAAETLSRLPEGVELADLRDTMSAVRAAGRARGMEPQITLYFDMTYSASSDPVISEATLLYETAVIAEAFSLGADNVLITGLPTDGGRITDADGIFAIIEKLRSSAPDIKLTLAFPPETFADRSMSQTLDALAKEAGALAVDTLGLDWSYSETEEEYTYTDEQGQQATGVGTVRHSSIYSALDDAASSIKSSVSLYSLGFVIRGDVTYNESEAVDALSRNGAYGYFVISAPEEYHAPASPETGGVTEPDTTAKPGKPETSKPSETKPPASTTAPPATTEAPVTEAPGTEAPGTQEPPVTDEPQTDKPTETEPDEGTETDAPEPDTSDKADTTSPETTTEPEPKPEEEPPRDDNGGGDNNPSPADEN